MKKYNTFRSEVRPRIFAGIMLVLVMMITYLIYRNGIDDINIWMYILPIIIMCLSNSIWHYTVTRLIYGYKNKYDALDASENGQWEYLYIHPRKYDNVTDWIFYDPIGKLAGTVDVGMGNVSHSVKSRMILRLFGGEIGTEIHAHPTKRRNSVQSKVDPNWSFRMIEKRNGQLRIMVFKTPLAQNKSNN